MERRGSHGLRPTIGNDDFRRTDEMCRELRRERCVGRLCLYS
jgi:hypothetical protein